MTRTSILAVAGIACLLAATATARPEESAANAPVAVDLATPDQCDFPFFHRQKWWSSCITLSSSNGKPWCQLKKGLYSVSTSNNATAYCDPKKITPPRASHNGVVHDCLVQTVGNETYTGCSGQKKEGPFLCKVNANGKDDFGKCLTLKVQLDSVEGDDAKAALAGPVRAAEPEGNSSLNTIVTVTVTVGAVALLAGLFVYRRRQSQQNASTPHQDKDMHEASMSTTTPKIAISAPQMAAAATATTLSDLTYSQYTSTANNSNSQVLSPTQFEEFIYPVVNTYTPTLGDELEIQPGDKVSILIEYDDGWCQGVNHTRGGLKGVFPRHCVDMTAGVPIDDSTTRTSANTSSAGYNA